MSPPPGALRAARHARGWSLTETAQRLIALGAVRGVRVATVRSLRTQLSRWENGHAVPEPAYRALLAELLARSPGALGITPAVVEPAAASADRLRAALDEADAVDDSAVERWSEQLAAIRRLDDELGTEAAAGLTSALVERLEQLLRHSVVAGRRSAVAEVLSGATALAGTHALDRRALDDAWWHYGRARETATVAGSPAALAAATAGLVDVLVEVGRSDVALTLLAEVDREESSTAAVRLRAAAAAAAAAARHPMATHAALAELAACIPPALDDGAARPGSSVVDRFYPADPRVELADLHRWRARALTLLGEPAVDELRQALAAGQRTVRHRAEVHADLAVALAASASPEAAHHAHEARALALRIGAPRITARLAPPGTPS